MAGISWARLLRMCFKDQNFIQVMLLDLDLDKYFCKWSLSLTIVSLEDIRENVCSNHDPVDAENHNAQQAGQQHWALVLVVPELPLMLQEVHDEPFPPPKR
jgi:hypothetical protein